MNIVDKILKESNDNLFQPRKIEDRLDQAKQRRIELEKELKILYDGTLHLLLDKIMKFILDNNLTITTNEVEKEKVDTESEYYDPSDNNYWWNILIVAQGIPYKKEWSRFIEEIDQIALEIMKIAEKKDLEFSWEFIPKKTGISFDIDMYTLE